jgi:hypothetical protein
MVVSPVQDASFSSTLLTATRIVRYLSVEGRFTDCVHIVTSTEVGDQSRVPFLRLSWGTFSCSSVVGTWVGRWCSRTRRGCRTAPTAWPMNLGPASAADAPRSNATWRYRARGVRASHSSVCPHRRLSGDGRANGRRSGGGGRPECRRMSQTCPSAPSTTPS